MYGQILFKLDTSTADYKYTLAPYYILPSDQRWLTGTLAAILVVEKPCVEHILNHFSDVHLPILFKIGKDNEYGLHKHAIWFQDQMQDG